MICQKSNKRTAKVDLSKETKTDLQQSISSKGKEPICLYVIFGSVIVISFMVLLNKYSKKSN